MALTANQIGVEVQAELGKSTSDTTITTARVLRWLNQSIKDIIYKYPGLRDVNVLDKTTWKGKTDQYVYQLSDFIDRPVAHIIKLKLINTTNNDYNYIEPYVGGLDQWDAEFPYIPNVGFGASRFHSRAFYIQRGYTIEVVPAFGTNDDGKPIWIEYSYLPRELTATDTPVLRDFDEVLIQWAKRYAFRVLGMPNESQEAHIYARELAEARVDGEATWDIIEQMADNGP